MIVKVSEITNIMEKALRDKGYDDDNIPFIIDMYLSGELRGHTSHGLTSFKGFLEHDYSNLPKPEAIKATDACYFIDAKSNPGVLIGRKAADEAIKRAKKQIIGVTLIKNMDSWLRPGVIAEYIVEKGFMAYVTNSGGNAAVAPPGGYEPVASTNPFAYGWPTVNGTFVVDMATSKRAWGEVRMANKLGTKLPRNTFYDGMGHITTNPKEATSVMSFGEHKGFALTFLTEVMTGALLGVPMHINSGTSNNFGDKMPERGACIIAIDISQTVGLDEFKTQVGYYVDGIEKTKPLAGQKIRIPGQQAMEKANLAIQTDEVEIPNELWTELQELTKSEA